MRGQIKHIAVVDVEATCWETKEEQGTQPNEIIEIGACLLDVRSGAIIERASIAVKPRFTKITPFCTTLTGWTQEQIDEEGLDIEEALKEFSRIYSPHGVQHWTSYGEYDRHKLTDSRGGLGQLYGLYRGVNEILNPFAMFRGYFNTKTMAGLRFNRGKEMGMEKMLEKLNIPLEGRHHNGADDANNIAKILWRTIQP